MKAYTLVIALSILAIGHDVRAQTPDPLSFFPHHQGDIWEYVDPFIPGFYEQNIITSDTLGPDGRYYVVTTLFGRMRLDTTTLEVHGQRWAGTEYANLIYKLDADSGHRWVAQRFQGVTVKFATVRAVFQSVVFGQMVTVKQIDYTDSASGLLLDTDYLASSFGLIGQDNDAMPYRRTRGAIINGVQHGTVTLSVSDPQRDFPTTIALHQNFPNPFNPSTDIVYEIPRGGKVKLKVYDLLGREVQTLVNIQQAAGLYTVRFDGKGLASGVYLYRLTIEDRSISKRMTLLR